MPCRSSPKWLFVAGHRIAFFIRRFLLVRAALRSARVRGTGSAGATMDGRSLSKFAYGARPAVPYLSVRPHYLRETAQHAARRLGGRDRLGKIEPRGFVVAAQIDALGIDPADSPTAAGAAEQGLRQQIRGSVAAPGRSARSISASAAAERVDLVVPTADRGRRSTRSGRSRRRDARVRPRPDRAGNRQTRRSVRSTGGVRQNVLACVGLRSPRPGRARSAAARRAVRHGLRWRRAAATRAGRRRCCDCVGRGRTAAAAGSRRDRRRPGPARYRGRRRDWWRARPGRSRGSAAEQTRQDHRSGLVRSSSE